MGKAEKAAPLKGNIETLHELACLPIADVNFSGSVAYRQPLVSVVRKLRLSVVNAKPSRETTLGSSAPGAEFRRGTLGIIAFNNRARSQKIWTTGVWKELPLRGIRVEALAAADCSPDGRFLALGYKDWEVATRHLLETLPGPPAWVLGVTICGDSRRAALGGSSTKDAVILWDTSRRDENC